MPSVHLQAVHLNVAFDEPLHADLSGCQLLLRHQRRSCRC